jgi:hypothetical protein
MGLPAETNESTSRFAASLEAEANTGIKREYRDGQIVAMAGGSPATVPLFPLFSVSCRPNSKAAPATLTAPIFACAMGSVPFTQTCS